MLLLMMMTDDAVRRPVRRTPIFVALNEATKKRRLQLSVCLQTARCPPPPPSLFIRVTNHPRYRKIAAFARRTPTSIPLSLPLSLARSLLRRCVFSIDMTKKIGASRLATQQHLTHAMRPPARDSETARARGEEGAVLSWPRLA